MGGLTYIRSRPELLRQEITWPYSVHTLCLGEVSNQPACTVLYNDIMWDGSERLGIPVLEEEGEGRLTCEILPWFLDTSIFISLYGAPFFLFPSTYFCKYSIHT